MYFIKIMKYAKWVIYWSQIPNYVGESKSFGTKSIKYYFNENLYRWIEHIPRPCWYTFEDGVYTSSDCLSAPSRNRIFPFGQQLEPPALRVSWNPFIRLRAVAARGEPRRQLSAPLPGFEKTSTSVLLNILCHSTPQNYFPPLQSTIKFLNLLVKGETCSVGVTILFLLCRSLRQDSVYTFQSHN